MFRSSILTTLTLMLASSGAIQAQQSKLSDDALATTKGNNVFAFDLYAQLNKEDKEQGNLFFSPYSISSALAMTYGGARGKTAEEMAATMHFSLPPDRLHPACGELVKYMNAKGADRPYQLSVANALWGQKGYNFLPSYLKLTEDHYGARLTDLDFMSKTEESRQIINKWVEKETQDKIKDLIPKDALTQNTKLVLTNAIYFKAGWTEKFLKDATKPGDFTLEHGQKVKADMMQKTQPVPYFDGGDFQAVSLPYKDNALSMIVLLPKKAGGLVALEKQLTSANLESWLKKMSAHEVNLKLPKFKFTSKFMMAKTLKEMGMKAAFTDADFSGISTQSALRITEVIHQAFVDVHEEGTEAAAATAVILGDKSAPNYPPATFHADRSFAFLIRDNASGSVLFLGRVTSPAMK